MYFFDPPDMVFAAGSMVLWNLGSLNQRAIWQRERETGPQYGQKAEDVDFIVGCGVLFRRQVLEQVGLLDGRFFLNYEDVDICIRARRAGFRVRYTPHAVLYHKVSSSLGQASARNTYYMTRNALLFFWMHLHGWRRWQTVARIVVRNLGHILVWTFKPAYRTMARSKRDANLLALRDALLRRFGQAGPDLEAICQRK
jgi:GT2 family glycosyltransferase